MEVLSDNKYFRDVNFLHTAYYSTELMLYFEKHHIFEILHDLMILLDRKRPDDVCEFMAEELIKIANKYNGINLSVQIHSGSCNIASIKDRNIDENFYSLPDYEQFLKISSRVLRAPILQVKHPTSKKCLKKLPDELRRFRLNTKNLIFIGNEINETIANLLSKIFIVNRHMNLDIDQPDFEGSKKLDPLATLVSTAQDINNTVKLLKRSPGHATVKYVERIVIIGRPGSGKHRQARMLADRLDTVLVSAKELITRARIDSKCFKKTLEIGFEDNVHTSELITTIVEKRLLEPDCLQFGWVLVDFPNTAEDVENFFRLMVAPQKIVFLHANERLCRKRKSNKLKFLKTTVPGFDNVTMENILNTEFLYFNFHKQPMIDTLKKQDCVLLDINANRKKQKVQKEILEKLLKL